MSFFFLSQISMAIHVVIDPGHGGTDTGATYGKAIESKITLQIAEKLKLELEKKSGTKVTMTRINDQLVSLADRVKIGQDAGGDIFISLHANSAPDKRAKGMEIFFQNNLPPDEDSMYLANVENQLVGENVPEGAEAKLTKKGDVDAIIEDLKRQHRMMKSIELTQAVAMQTKTEAASHSVSIKQAPFYVVAKAKMPSTLIEVGFLTNPNEAKELMTDARQQRIASSIAEAINRLQID